MAQEPAVPAQARRTSTSLLCHGSPVRLEEFEYIFAPEQARECLPHLGRARPHHAHRPLAPLQGVRADDEQRRGAARRSTSSSTPDKKYIVSRRLGRPAARLRQPRELHASTTPTRSASSSSASSTTSRSPRTRSCARASSATSRTASSSASEPRAARSLRARPASRVRPPRPKSGGGRAGGRGRPGPRRPRRERTSRGRRRSCRCGCPALMVPWTASASSPPRVRSTRAVVMRQSHRRRRRDDRRLARDLELEALEDRLRRILGRGAGLEQHGDPEACSPVR